jgi:hypothetical protein
MYERDVDGDIEWERRQTQPRQSINLRQHIQGTHMMRSLKCLTMREMMNVHACLRWVREVRASALNEVC